jgi:hypothetical protein
MGARVVVVVEPQALTYQTVEQLLLVKVTEEETLVLEAVKQTPLVVAVVELGRKEPTALMLMTP